ncbi:MAG TPA: ATP-binding protein [Patescibacteria group bacterium]|nr:ATP-binding protein [Patescibacteria group bacterium]
MTAQQIRDRLALFLAILAVLAGISAAVFGSYDTGIHWHADDGRIVVDWVETNSQADRDGVRSGFVALDVNGNVTLQLPQYVYGEPPVDQPDQPPPVLGTDPALPTPARNETDLARIASEPIEYVTFISPEALATGSPETWQANSYNYPGTSAFRRSQLAVLPALLVLIGGLWWLRSTRVGKALRGLAIPLVVAVVVPLLIAPVGALGSAAAVLVSRMLIVLGMLSLALGLTALIRDVDDRRLVLLGVAGLALGATIASFGVAFGDAGDEIDKLLFVLTALIPLLPGVVAAGPIDLGQLRVSSSLGAGGLLQSTELALAGATPLFALASAGDPWAWPLVLWLLGLVAAARFTVRPLARLATRATLQRDLVVAATEAERARLAADIHDDALQELTLLVRRLEASGDTEGAEIGRTVADRLRAICGDLRLPILDDLGVGPALDWLVLRIERLAGGEVRLERSDDARHSPDVELAIFRVAQEALANAVKHGSPPIVVRYRSTPAGISLAIDDAGPGITDDAPATAERAGRFGLLNMAQRAEQIGAILDVKRWPTGGTHVALEWRPR